MAYVKTKSKRRRPRKKKFSRSSVFTVAAILAAVAIVLLVLSVSYSRISKSFFPMQYSEYVEKYSAEYDVDPLLVYSVIKAESNFNPTAVSSANAKGIMQMTPETFEWLLTKTGEELSEDDLFDPQVGIKYGTLLLSMNIDEFQDTETAIAAYHAGRGKVAEWLESDLSDDGIHLNDIPYEDTSGYVVTVMRYYKIYIDLYLEK